MVVQQDCVSSDVDRRAVAQLRRSQRAVCAHVELLVEITEQAGVHKIVIECHIEVVLVPGERVQNVNNTLTCMCEISGVVGNHERRAKRMDRCFGVECVDITEFGQKTNLYPS
jgi:hypothetical protein